MSPNLNDPFTAMLALQRALESRRESDWMGRTTAGIGGYPPINIFQQGNEFVAVIELPGVDKSDLQIEAKEKTIRISGTKPVSLRRKGQCAQARALVRHLRSHDIAAVADRCERHPS